MPPWVLRGATFFVTINARTRGTDGLTTGNKPQRLLASAVHYHERGTWWLHLLVIMPDHLHALLVIAPDRELTKVLSAWKAYQTKSLRVGWQAGFFDHRLCNDESFEEKANYIRMNPVRATGDASRGLVACLGAELKVGRGVPPSRVQQSRLTRRVRPTLQSTKKPALRRAAARR